MHTLSTLIATFVDMPTITNGAALTRYVRLRPAEARSAAPRRKSVIDKAERYAARAVVARSDARNCRH